jgi:hypothetical protein
MIPSAMMDRIVIFIPDQFKGSLGSLDGCGTRTTREFAPTPCISKDKELQNRLRSKPELIPAAAGVRTPIYSLSGIHAHHIQGHGTSWAPNPPRRADYHDLCVGESRSICLSRSRKFHPEQEEYHGSSGIWQGSSPLCRHATGEIVNRVQLFLCHVGRCILTTCHCRVLQVASRVLLRSTSDFESTDHLNTRGCRRWALLVALYQY